MLNASPRMIMLAAAALVTAGVALLLRATLEMAPPPPLPAPVVVAPPPMETEIALPAFVVAQREIPRGAVVERAALGLVRMERAPAADAATSPDAVLGRVALERIAPGQTLLLSALTGQPAAAGLGPLVPAGQRAVTLRLAEDTGIGFLVRPGDRVDVLIATRDDQEPAAMRGTGPANLARLVLQDVQVLAVGEALSAEAPPAQGSAARNQAPLRNATLALPPEQLPLLALARADGGYVLALRNPADRDIAEVPRIDRAALLGEEAPAPPPAAAPAQRPAPARPAARSGPEMILGPTRGPR
jgi:pilus assembly protein CpaB